MITTVGLRTPFTGRSSSEAARSSAHAYTAAAKPASGECVATLDSAVPRTSDARSGRVAAGWQVEDVDQAVVFVDGVVKVPDLGGAAVRVRGADELPDAVIGVMLDQQNGLAALEDLEGLDAGGS